MKKYFPLKASSKFGICGLPLVADTQRMCSFQCSYCFASNRKFMNSSKEDYICDIDGFKKLCEKVFIKKNIDEKNFVEVLLSKGITIHLGSMCDPFSKCEEENHNTKRFIDICNQYDKISLLISTKSTNIYNCNLDPKKHALQMSFSNSKNNEALEKNVETFENRVKFYKKMKSLGFRIGIRIQPFIPGITSLDIIDTFKDAEHITIEGIKIVPHNKKHAKKILDICNLSLTEFQLMGLYNLKHEKRNNIYKPFIEKMEEYNMSYSIADNDMHDIGNNKCCCGDSLINNCTSFNNTSLIKKYGIYYTKEQIMNEIVGYEKCKINHLFSSNRQKENCKTIHDFIKEKYEQKTAPTSPNFIYNRTLKCKNQKSIDKW